MKIHRTIFNALRAIRRNPMRSLLTTLGVVIGVASVIAMMEIGSGSSSAIRKTIESMGADSLIVLPGNASAGGVSFGAGTVMSLTPSDYEAIMRECSSLRGGTPLVYAGRQLIFGGRNWSCNIVGAAPSFLDVRNWTLAEGECFTENDIYNISSVCVVGQTIVRELFLGESPIGKELVAGNVSLKVVGVFAAKGAGMMGEDQDDIVVSPWTTVRYRISGLPSSQRTTVDGVSNSVNSISQIYPSSQPKFYPSFSSNQLANTKMFVRFTTVNNILVAANTPDDKPYAIQQMTAVLRERHNLQEGDLDDFRIFDRAEMSETLASTSKLMTKLLFGVALISLVVGGVGIMNIMLVSVTERTREIGLRMAVGARSQDILRQFLTEAISLCLIGGLIGIGLGHGGSQLIKHFLHWPVETSPLAIAVSVMVSAGVGIIFGYYPAWKASRLDPIEALRHE